MHEKEIKKMHKNKDAEISGIVSRLKEKYRKKVSHTSGIPFPFKLPFSNAQF